MGKIGEWLGLVVGGKFYIGIIFMLLCLPFSVITLMRWFEFSWWGALSLSMVLAASLALAGCYFFVRRIFIPASIESD